ncbi:MAG: beta-galactosidase [Pseudomonadota bacterium]
MTDPIHRPTLGVCYYPEHWPESQWADDAAQMAAIGITHVRIGEFAWTRYEPEPSELTFDWLLRAMDVLHDAGLKVIVGTPTATPPKWLVDRMPDMLAIDENGNPRGFGSRRHYCFSHTGYRTECVRIIKAMAEAVKDHPALCAWQTDNEYGCHDTIISYSESASRDFRIWLAGKYGHNDISALNKAWGNVFWSMEYRSYDEVDLPLQPVTEINPSHMLDFRRFSSDQVRVFNAIQCHFLRQITPDVPIVHNFMGWFTEFDHFDVSRDLDIASWDSYPLGFLERVGPTEERRNTYAHAGDPDFQAFHHDLYRACGKVREPGQRSRWWVMEQQPGPVNWARWNPAPAPGMVRLWTHEAIAHGAELVSYFRWRQAPFAQEQYHAGLNLPDGTPDDGSREAAQVAQELTDLDLTCDDVRQAPVALVFDYPSVWTGQIQPQGETYDMFLAVLRWYRAARRLGLDVDIVPAGASLDGYKLVLVPALLTLDEAVTAALEESDAVQLFAPRTASKTPDFQIPGTLPPGGLQRVMPIRVERVESLRPGLSIPLERTGAMQADFIKWREFTTPIANADVEAVRLTQDGHPALWRADKRHYLCGVLEEEPLTALVAEMADMAGLDMMNLPDGVRTRSLGQTRYFFNYGDQPRDLTHFVCGKVLLGSPVTLGHDILVVRET